MKRLPHGERFDLWLAGFLMVASQLELWLAHTDNGSKCVTVPGTLAICASVAFRRRWPLAVALVQWAILGAQFVVGQQQNVAIAIAWFCGLYALAVWTSTRAFVVGCLVLPITNAVTEVAQKKPASGNDWFMFTAVPILAMLIARRAIRDREELARGYAARAELLERDQELRAQEAVAEERARIARELHDLVAHNVSVMVVQAGAERHALGDERPSTRETLAAIEQAGRQALAEARRLLGMLRRDGEHEALEPQPSIADVDALVEQVRRVGLDVALTVEGERGSLPAGVDLCAYRIVQEGLTNALKHAGPGHADVVLRYTPRALAIEVCDDGNGSAPRNGDGAGHGLVGMRERVALYGGRLEAGPRTDGGGFRVHAEIPIA